MFLSIERIAERVSVVMVSYNSARVIDSALNSVPPGTEIIVIDNFSNDDSLIRAKKAGAFCIANTENIGFGRASNMGAAAATREFILFLNPDAVLMPGALELMLDAMLRNPDAGAVGPMLVDESGASVWRHTSALHPMSSSQQFKPTEPEGLCCMPLLTGAALLCRRSALAEIGGFDDRIFLYYEDDDLCVRMRKHGWSLLYEPSAVVVHALGKSSCPSLTLSRTKARHRLQSLEYVSRKYGLRFDPVRERVKAFKRLAIAVLLFDAERRAAALGRLDALASMSKTAPADGASTERIVQYANARQRRPGRASGHYNLTPQPHHERPHDKSQEV